jgi:MFS family permease
MIIILAFLLGTANAFDAPARLAFVVEMVKREDIPNAVALNASMFNLATVIGPAVSGLTYALVGPAWCFFLNGVSFIAVIIGLLLMKLEVVQRRPRHLGGSWEEIKEGLHFVLKNNAILVIMLNLGLVGMFGIGLVSLLPAWANTVLKGDVTVNGYLLSARGVGSLIAALILAYLSGKRVKGKLWNIGSLMLPVAMLVFVFMNNLSFSLLAMVWIGLAFMMVTNASNALIQDLTSDELRGRVMSIYTLAFFGMAPIGGLLMGVMASKISEPLTVGICGVFLLVVSVAVYFLKPGIRELK